MMISVSAIMLAALFTLSVFLSVVNLFLGSIQHEDRTPLWLSAWLGISAVFALCRLLQFLPLAEPLQIVVPRIMLMSGYALAWVGYELANAFIEYSPSRRERILILILTALPITLLWASDLILTDQVVARTIVFGDKYYGVLPGSLYLPACLLILAISLVPLVRLLRAKTLYRRNNLMMAMGFVFVILFSLVDFLAVAFNVVWIRLSDYSYLPMAIFFSFIQIQRLGELYREMDKRVRERTAELWRINEALLAEIEERKQAEEALRRQAVVMTTLYETTHDLVIEQGLSTLLQTIVERATGLMNASGGGLYLCEPEQRQLRCVVSYNTTRDYSGVVLKYGEGAAGVVAETEEPLIIEDYRTWEKRAAIYEQDQPFVSMLSVPLRWQGQVIGVIHVLENDKPRNFTHENMRVLSLFADQAAVAIANSRLFEAEQRRRQEADIIAEIGSDISSTLHLNVVLERIATHARDLLGAQMSAVYLAEPASNTLRAIAATGPEAQEILDDPLRVGDGILGNIALQKTGEIVNNSAADPRAITVKGTEIHMHEHLIGVPVLSENHLTGLIAVWRTGAGLEFKLSELGFLEKLAGQVAVAIANARLFEAEQKRRREADTLRQAAEKINSTLNQEQAIQWVLEQLAKVVSYSSASVQLLREGCLEVVGGRGWPDPSVVLGMQFFIPGENPNSTVVLERRPVVLDDAPEAYPIFNDPPHRHIRSWLGVPLIVRDRVIGMFALDHDQPDFFTQADVQLVGAFASQAAIAIENARLFEETQRRLREMEGLAQVSASLSHTLELGPLLEIILQTVIRAVPAAERGSLLLADDKGNLNIRAVWGYSDPRVREFSFPSDSGYAALAFRERRAIVVDDVRANQDIRYEGDIPEMRMGGSAIAAPLIVKDHPIGVIAIDTPTHVSAFHAGDLHLLTAISTSVALAIENARLFDDTRRRLSEIEAVHTVSTALRSARTLDEALPIILDQLMSLLNAKAASLEMVDAASGEIVTELAHGIWARVTGLRTPAGSGVSGHVIASGRPYVSTDVLADGMAVRPDLFGGLQAMACVPVIAQRQPIGALWIGRETAILKEEVSLLSAVGEMVGNAIQRMRLNEQTERRADEFEALYLTAYSLTAQWDLHNLLETVVTQAMSLLHAPGGGIYLYDPTHDDLQVVVAKGPAMRLGTHLRVGEGMAGRVLREQKPFIIDNYLEWTGHSSKYEHRSIRAVVEVPITFAGELIGVLVAYETVDSKRKFTEADARLLSLFAAQTASAIRNARLLEELQTTNFELAQAYDTTLEGWARALELRDKETEGHSRRVTELTLRLARQMDILEPDLTHIRRGVLLHDIGKMGISDQLLHKNAPLSDEEWVEMRKHPQYAYDLLSPIAYLRPVLDIPYCHHERWDGSGYPRGLKGKQIPLAARIFAIVDVYDALSVDRPYREAWPNDKVLDYLREQSGRQFDPDIVKAFLMLIQAE